ncbi:MAG: T9SS type A sorting domain-containing protein [candidate division WOR-3 bacterium]|nr:T9SS type A sorting domain-containing protein [candidate division WOR-3 bacterium]
MYFIIFSLFLISDSLNIRSVGRYPYSIGSSIVVDENFIYTASGGVVTIFERNNPREIINTIQVPYFIVDIGKEGDNLFILTCGVIYRDTHSYFYIYNVSNPLEPYFLSSYLIPNQYAVSLCLQNRYLYVTGLGWRTESRLSIFDVSNPYNPILVSAISLMVYTIDGIDIFNNLACVTTGGPDRIYLINISNPNNPSIISYWEADESTYLGGKGSIKIKDTLLYVTFSTDGESVRHTGIFTFNISNPSNPLLINRNYFESPLITEPGKIDILDTLLYFAFTVPGREYIFENISIFNIKNGLPIYINCWEADSFFGLGGASRIIIKENIYYGIYACALLIYDVSNPQLPRKIFKYHIPCYNHGVLLRDTIAFLFYANGILILSITNPNNPKKILFYTDSTCYSKFFWMEDGYIKDDTILITTGDYLNVFNISDIRNPFLLTTVGVLFTHDIFVYGNYAYVAGNQDGLLIYDISDILRPTLIGRFPVDGQVWHIFVDSIRNKAYLASSMDGLLIVNIANPRNPYLLGRYQNTNPDNLCIGVAARNDTVYLGYERGLEILDCRRPTAIRRIYYNPDIRVEKIYFKENRAYIAGRYAGVYILDISNFASPRIIGYYNTHAVCNEVEVDDRGLIHAATYMGYFILEYYGIGKEEDRNNNLNKPKIIRKDKRVVIKNFSEDNLEILNILGKKERSFDKEKIKKNRKGEIEIDISEFSSGVYFLSIKKEGKKEVFKVVIIK